MSRVLSVSYDESLLMSRQQLLESRGLQVSSVLGFTEALRACQSGGSFDLFIVGHSIPHADKEALVSAFRKHHGAPVIALKKYGEAAFRGADFHVDPEPSEVLAVVSRILSGPAPA